MLAKYFDFDQNRTDLKTEVLAGVTAFLATAYITILNPIILSQAGMSFPAVVTATVLVSALGSILMGLYGKNPIVVAPGMGLNAFFAFSVVAGMGATVEEALGAVFWSGVIFVILSVTNIRSKIVKAIPKSQRMAVSCGIGLFIALIGFSNAGLVVKGQATLVTAGPLNAVTITFLLGLVLTSIFMVKKIPGGAIVSIFLTTLMCYPIGRYYGDASFINHGVKTLVSFNGIYSPADFGLLFKMDVIGALKWGMVPVIFSFVFTDLFDSLSTFMGVAEAGNLLDESGDPRNLKESLFCDAIATLSSAIFGSSPGTSYIESAAAIQGGGRTGLVAVVAGVLFLPLMFFSPLLSMIPSIATAPILVIVGVFMMAPVSKIDWAELEEGIPAFLAMFLIPLSYSISQGIIWGLLSYSVLKLLVGKGGDIPVTLWGINLLCVLSLYFTH
ncbi:MAG: NCS2 family permease [Bacteriovoracaceae bacterium]|nr:NCS2 family permease [Bacteriovoracaceae bacterium]